MDEVPEPTGKYDLKTEKAILRYQTNHRTELLTADGVIDPASYNGRNILHHASGPHSRVMTITDLHCDLHVLFDPRDYTTELTRIVPQLVPWLKG
jgi:hypothetical protein